MSREAALCFYLNLNLIAYSVLELCAAPSVTIDRSSQISDNLTMAT